MTEWFPQDEFSDEALASVEELLRLAADDMPTVRSGLKAETITKAQKVRREIHIQHVAWGGLAAVMLFLGGLIWWPASAGSALAANENPPPEPAAVAPSHASDAVDWELVESKKQLRKRNLEILRNAF